MKFTFNQDRAHALRPANLGWLCFVAIAGVVSCLGGGVLGRRAARMMALSRGTARTAAVAAYVECESREDVLSDRMGAYL